MTRAPLSGWGRYPVLPCRLERPADVADLRELLRAGEPLIARGNGRGYGDCALQPEGATASMLAMNRMLDFDARQGLLTVQAGVLLADIVDAFLPRGWFPAVTPGTRFVTVGGMIAADVHGKNHHAAGSLRRHVAWLDLLAPSGGIVRCSPSENAELFDCTFGGMGLTGVVLRACLRLAPVRTAWIRQETVVATDLAQAMDAFETSASWTYTVAWIDCLARGAALGRSLLFRGEHAEPGELPEAWRQAPLRAPAGRGWRVPVDLPAFLLNRLSVRAFNALYFRAGARAPGSRLVDWRSFFYPLDAIGDWNRIYGARGFAQYQCVIPQAAARGGLAALLDTISAAGEGSFLAVLKQLGPQDGSFSFPMRGYTLALDFPVNPRTLALMEELDRIVAEHGGRIYLAKDARISRERFAQTEPRAAAFRRLRQARGMHPRYASALSRRLDL